MGQGERFRTLEQDRFDAIIVGAGTGGLTAGAILAKHGHSVLVCDQHYVAGGNATVFRRPGYEFDVGLHYIGDCGPNGLIPRVLREAGVDDVSFLDLDPDAYDIFHFPDFSFPVPSDLDIYRDRLVSFFPSERRGIDRYIKMLRQAWVMAAIPNNPWRALWQWPSVLLPFRYLNKTLEAFFDSCTDDPKLRAVWMGNQIIYTQPPSRLASMMHILGTMHYMQGPCYPEGGGQVISDRLAESIEANGGKILLRATVEAIHVEDGKATGITLMNRHTGRRHVQAPVVISNADLMVTMRDLVGLEHFSEQTRKQFDTFEMAPGLGVVYLGATPDVERPLPRCNHVVFPEYDVEPLYAATKRGEMYPNPYCCVTVASAKDPDNPHVAPEGVINMQLMGVAPSPPASWGTTDAAFADGSYRKDPAYLDAKEAFTQRMLDLASQVYPDLKEQVQFIETCTPLTHVRYTGSTNGTSYGLAQTPEQFLFQRPDVETEIDGLYLCGASIRAGHGIPGVMQSGLAAAATQLGGLSYFRKVLR
jgi:phytoene desaturase